MKTLKRLPITEAHWRQTSLPSKTSGIASLALRLLRDGSWQSDSVAINKPKAFRYKRRMHIPLALIAGLLIFSMCWSASSVAGQQGTENQIIKQNGTRQSKDSKPSKSKEKQHKQTIASEAAVKKETSEVVQQLIVKVLPQVVAETTPESKAAEPQTAQLKMEKSAVVQLATDKDSPQVKVETTQPEHNAASPVVQQEQPNLALEKTSVALGDNQDATPKTNLQTSTKKVDQPQANNVKESTSTLDKTNLAIIGTLAGFVAVGGYMFNRKQSIPLQDLHQKQVTPKPPLKLLSVCGLAYSEPTAFIEALIRAYPEAHITESNAMENAAVHSVAGHNEENQDYSILIGFTHPVLGQISISVIADGCGGHYGGKQASFTAATAAVSEMITESKQVDDLAALAKKGFNAAKSAVESTGALYGPHDFRTTLIIVLASETEYCVCHIGDGGAVIRRQNGNWFSMLEPMREEKTGYLTGSLGPKTYGTDQVHRKIRQPGDVFVAGSDGLFVDNITDREAFFAWLIKAPNPSESLGRFITELLKHDMFDDNISAVFLKTHRAVVPQIRPTEAHQSKLNAYKTAAAL